MKRNAFFLLLTALPFSALCLSGCLNLEPKPDPTQFYVLGASSAISQKSMATQTPKVSRIELPKYLQRNEIAIRKSDHEIEFMTFNRWAEPLEAGFVRVFENELAKYNFDEKETRFTIEVLRFEASGEEVLLEARIVDHGHFKVQMPLAQPKNPSAIVSAMTLAVQQLAQDVTVKMGASAIVESQ